MKRSGGPEMKLFSCGGGMLSYKYIVYTAMIPNSINVPT